MKKYIIAALMFTAVVSAQEHNPKLEAFGELVKATYYHDNGQIQQQGYFKNGKLEGQWVAYDTNGNKVSVAEYQEGKKTGKWIFWTDQKLSEVAYADNELVSVKNWKQEALVDRN